MQNLLWYIGLAIIGIGITAYTIYIKRNNYKVSTLLVFYLYVAGFTWICEFIGLGMFNSYAYKTGFFTDIWAQNLLGHLILNSTLYPSAAIVVVTNSRRYAWIALFASFFTSVEYLFINLGIYDQHWWRYYMTIIVVVIFLLIVSKWFDKINHGSNKLTRTITFYFVAMVIVHMPAPILLLMGKQYYYIGLINNFVGNFYRSSIIIIFLYHIIECFLLVLFSCILKKWYWRVLPFIISLISQIIFAKMGILVMEGHWKLIYTLLIYEIAIAIFILIEKNTLKTDLN